MVLVKGPESRLLWANKAFLTYYGMTEEQLDGLVDGPQSNPDDTLQYVRDDKYVFDTEKDLDIPSEPVTNSLGEVNYFHTIKSPVFQNQKMIQAVGVTRLIGDENLEKQKLTELDAKVFTAPLRSIINTLPTATMLLDHDLRIIKCNDRWCELFGTEPSSSKDKFNVIYKKLTELTEDIEKSTYEKKELGKLLSVKIDDLEKFFDFKITPWKYPNNFVGGAIVVATDVSLIKASERNLIKANRQLSVANEELAQFAYRTSHDLKAPLATIKGLTDFIEEDLNSGDLPEVKKNVKQVFLQASKLETLVVDILKLARTELEIQEYEMVSISEICDDIGGSYSELLKDKNVKLNCEGCGKFRSQKTRVKQILANLIANSIKYSNPSIENRFVNVDCSLFKDCILISVTDNGVGIELNDREKVFDMFSRFNQNLAEGSGLGMSIVKKNIDALDGKIEFISSKAGTRFNISLPIIEDIVL